MKDVAFGSYYPTTSFVHKMDARIKILSVIAYIVAVFLVQSFHFLGFLACLLLVVVATIVSRVPITKVLKSIKGILFIIIDYKAIAQKTESRRYFVEINFFIHFPKYSMYSPHNISDFLFMV